MDRIWNDNDLTLIDEAYEPEIAHEIKRFVQENQDLYPDLAIEIRDVIVQGPDIVTVWVVEGTHRDLGLPVRLEGVSVRRWEEGRIVAERMYYDSKSIYDQLGFSVTPPDGLSPFGVMMERGAETPVMSGESEPAPDPGQEVRRDQERDDQEVRRDQERDDQEVRREAPAPEPE